ncbi:hypothetical protein ABZX73_16375 [Brevibacterium casei]
MAEDPINPNYYQFPNGSEAIDITQYLSGCGAQAVQYIVRSTRLDKELKGSPLEDLKKAAWFIEKEVDRLTPPSIDGGKIASHPVDFGRIRPCESCNGSGSQPVADEMTSGGAYNVTIDSAKDIAAGGSDHEAVADSIARQFEDMRRIGRLSRGSSGSYL